MSFVGNVPYAHVITVKPKDIAATAVAVVHLIQSMVFIIHNFSGSPLMLAGLALALF